MAVSTAAKMANRIGAGRAAGVANMSANVAARTGRRRGGLGPARQVLSSGRTSNPNLSSSVTKAGGAGKSSGGENWWSKRKPWQQFGMVGGGAFIGGNMIGGSSGGRGAPAPRSTGGMMY